MVVGGGGGARVLVGALMGARWSVWIGDIGLDEDDVGLSVRLDVELLFWWGSLHLQDHYGCIKYAVLCIPILLGTMPFLRHRQIFYCTLKA